MLFLSVTAWAMGYVRYAELILGSEHLAVIKLGCGHLVVIKLCAWSFWKGTLWCCLYIIRTREVGLDSIHVGASRPWVLDIKISKLGVTIDNLTD